MDPPCFWLERVMAKQISQRAWNAAVAKRDAAARVVTDAVINWQIGRITTRALLVTVAENIIATDVCDEEIANVNAIIRAGREKDQTP